MSLKKALLDQDIPYDVKDAIKIFTEDEVSKMVIAYGEDGWYHGVFFVQEDGQTFLYGDPEKSLAQEKLSDYVKFELTRSNRLYDPTIDSRILFDSNRTATGTWDDNGRFMW